MRYFCPAFAFIVLLFCVPVLSLTCTNQLVSGNQNALDDTTWSPLEVLYSDVGGGETTVLLAVVTPLDVTLENVTLRDGQPVEEFYAVGSWTVPQDINLPVAGTLRLFVVHNPPMPGSFYVRMLDGKGPVAAFTASMAGRKFASLRLRGRLPFVVRCTGCLALVCVHSTFCCPSCRRVCAARARSACSSTAPTPTQARSFSSPAVPDRSARLHIAPQACRATACW